MGKICLKHGDLPSVPNALAVWLQYLPLKSDLEEAVVVNEQLCLFLERCAQRPRELKWLFTRTRCADLQLAGIWRACSVLPTSTCPRCAR